MLLAALVMLAPAAAGAEPRESPSLDRGAASGKEPRTWRIVSATPLGPDLSEGVESLAAYRRGVSALAAGDPGAAVLAFESSLASRPDRTSARILLGVSLLLAGSQRALGEIPLALRALAGDFEAQTRIAFNVLFAILCGLAAALAGGLAAPALRSIPFLAHEIAEAMPRDLPKGVRGAYPLVLLVAPVYMWRPWAWPAGLFWTLLLYALLARRHLRAAEKRLVATLGLVVVLLPSALVLLGLLAAPAVPRSLAFAVARARDPLFREQAGRAIESGLAWRENDVDLLFDLAILRREEGRVQEASDLYARILAAREDHAGARVNLGNIYLARGEPRRALAEYTAAVRSRPRSASAHYGLGQLLLEDFDFGGAKSHLRTAASLNFDFVQSLSRASLDGKETLLVDESPVARERWRWLVANRKEVLQITPREATAFLAAALLPSTRAGCALLAVLFAAAVALGRLSRRAEPCASCGRPVCRGCRVRLTRRSFCGECAAIVQSHDAPERIQQGKAARFRKAQAPSRIVALLLALLLPGAGHVYVGRRWLGLAMLFSAGFLLCLALTNGGPIAPLPRFDAEIQAIVQPGLFLALLNLHAVGIAHFWVLARRRLA